MPFIFDETQADIASYTPAELKQAYTSSPDLVGVPTIVQADDNESIEVPVTAGSNSPVDTTEKKVVELKIIFDERVDTNNSDVLNTAAVIAAKCPGDLTVDQVSAIYEYLKNGNGVKRGWSYVRDRRGSDYYRYANESLKMGGDADCSGVGDCDDFAILMSALVESIGGTTRIILAQNNTTGGHAYAEVYLGNVSDQNDRVEEIIDWLRQKYNTDKIYTHIDTDTRDVWLNLDWGPDEKGNVHPGGPFFQGDRHILLSIRDRYQKTPLLLSQGTSEGRSVAETITPGMHQEEAQMPQKINQKKNTSSNNVPVNWVGGVDALIDRGIAQYNEGDYEGANNLYDQALGLDSQNYLAWELKGLALRALGKSDEALDSFDRAISIDPGRADAWKDKGETYYLIGQYQDAVDCFDRAIQINPCSEYWTLKAEALRGTGNNKEASNAYVMAQKSASC